MKIRVDKKDNVPTAVGILMCGLLLTIGGMAMFRTLARYFWGEYMATGRVPFWSDAGNADDEGARLASATTRTARRLGDDGVDGSTEMRLRRPGAGSAAFEPEEARSMREFRLKHPPRMVRRSSGAGPAAAAPPAQQEQQEQQQQGGEEVPAAAQARSGAAQAAAHGGDDQHQ